MCDNDSQDEKISKIEALTNAVEKTKEDLINWSLKCDEEGDTAIHSAIIQENTQLCIYLCRLLASSGINLDIRNRLMQTPLHLACITGESELLSNLLDLNVCSTDCTDRNGNTCLHLAARYGNEDSATLRVLLNYINAEVKYQDIVDSKNIHGHSALHIASSFNKPEAIKLLAAHGAEINQPETKSGKSPLYLAVQERHAEAVQALLELGADANKPTYFRDSPSQLASSHDRRSMLRLISRFDPATHSQSPTLAFRRDSREASLMVSQRNYPLSSPANDSISDKIPSMASSDETASERDNTRQNVIVKNAPPISADENTAVSTSESVRQFAPVKSERLSPQLTSPPAYLPSSEIYVSRAQEKSHSVSTDGALNCRPDLSEINRVREQILRTVGSFSRLQPGNLTALNSFGIPTASMVPILAQEAAGSHNAFGPAGLFLPQHNVSLAAQHPPVAYLRRGKNEETSASRAQGIWPRPPFGYQYTAMAGYPGLTRSTNTMTADDMGGTETACVSTKKSPIEMVSIRKRNGTTFSAEPLDLSQSRHQMNDKSGSGYSNENSYRRESQANMLIEDGTMNSRCEDSVPKRASAREYKVTDDVRKKIKTEIVDDEAAEENNRPEVSYPTESVHVTEGHTSLPPYLPFQQLVYDRSLRETLEPYGASWHDLQGAVINPHSFLPHAAFGYVPAALAAKTPLQALASLDPNNLAQQNHTNGIVAGLSHWMNLSMDVARAVEKLRRSPRETKELSQSERKRKFGDSAEARAASCETVDDNTEAVQSAADASKRIRLHESLSDGLQRSVSDDPGKSQEKDSEAQKRGLERRNSAPSSCVVSQLLRQEDQKRITPVDLHSYTGCLPPHYLHLLQSSGNLPVTWRQHALREVTEVYDTKQKFPASESVYRSASGPSDVTRVVASKNRTTKERNSETDHFSHAQRPEGFRHSEPQGFSQKLMNNSKASHKEIWRPGVTDERDWIAGHLGVKSREMARKGMHTNEGIQKNSADCLPISEDRRKSIQNFGQGKKDFANRKDGNLSEKTRKSSETESDDEDYIPALQISDASSDEDDDAEGKDKYRQPNGQPAQRPFTNARGYKAPTSNFFTDAFGNGMWRKLDMGNMPAFGGSVMATSLSTTTSTGYISSMRSMTTPTKIAGSVKSKTPQAMNAFSRVYSSANMSHSKAKAARCKLPTLEFLPHDTVVHKSEKQAELIAPRLLQLPCVGSENHKCTGCMRVKDKHSGGVQDENTRKLIRDILRQSFKSNQQNSSVNTATTCQPRLVFSSDTQLPYESRAQNISSVVQVARENISTSPTSRAAESHCSNSLASSEAYTHKMFTAARTTKDRKHHVSHDMPTVTRSETNDYKSANSKGRIVSPFLTGTITLGSKRRVSSSSTSSNRLNSLDAKLEELHQKAMQATEAGTRTGEVGGQRRAREEERDSHEALRNPTGTKQLDQENIIPACVKTELPTVDENQEAYSPKSPARSRSQHPVAILEPRHRQPILSPFHEGENGRFPTRKNVAVIKPNQSSTERYRKEEKLPDYVCPPKKRHFKRYSPEFYNYVKMEASPHNREVRSASPVTRTPFVATNLLAKEDAPRNIRWGSPDSNRRRGSPDRRRMKASSPMSVLAYHIQRNHLKPFRFTGAHTVVLEQNFRKSPRYVTSPRSDAVIVVASRMPGGAGDERDERLEIGDLEISDDES